MCWLDSWRVNCTRLLAKVQAAFPQVREGGGSHGGAAKVEALPFNRCVGRKARTGRADWDGPASAPPLDTLASNHTRQAALVFKTTAPPLHRAEVEGVTHVGVDFGSPAAARAINAAGRAVAHEAGIMVLDAEVGGGGG